MTDIDTLDRKILHQLQQDATLPLEELGNRVGLSRNACWRRVKQLEDAGFLRGRVALLDPEKLDLGLSVFIQIRTNRHDADWLARFASATRAMPEILGVYRMSGDLDYLVRARVADMKAYDRMYQRLIEKIELSDVSASFVMEDIKDTTALPVL
ncbi:Lrp/AsnC family transcriptional regulator [Oceanomicrobium pacificus]|uniref:AsnC family transcriptional regulator n=1 Tax=Oceanomicrobium pacificus TaxID=2692916 RepID=A0A6B0TXV3_9RHOB|nr:Lrp/AsnC family transcriptional regulator [Oceanomicrobium pacificus]MXU66278.1 AsnC family transcriptional regulator [Oceanomicrobium pacificus]